MFPFKCACAYNRLRLRSWLMNAALNWKEFGRRSNLWRNMERKEKWRRRLTTWIGSERFQKTCTSAKGYRSYLVAGDYFCFMRQDKFVKVRDETGWKGLHRPLRSSSYESSPLSRVFFQVYSFWYGCACCCSAPSPLITQRRAQCTLQFPWRGCKLQRK